MAMDRNRDLDLHEGGESSERGGLLEEISIDGKKQSAIQRRFQEFEIDEVTKTRWKVLVVPGLCLFFGFIFGISAGVLLAGGDVARAVTSGTNSAGSKSDGEPTMCKISMPPGPRFREFCPMGIIRMSADCRAYLAPNILIRFEPNSTFGNASATDNETDSAWAALNPLGKGFVNLDQNGDVILYNGTHTPPANETKVVSIFHQLHCLNHLRRSLSASAANPLEFQYLVPQMSHHWDHCFDYLRQALMCTADITLERLQEPPKGSKSVPLTSVDGWGTTHLCRDYNVVRMWAESHRAGDDVGID
ncbi:hypothetical protein QBC37DRAFT_69842 [Rhypophila decipiens]|uniref:Tat pathway signal sequence n=1 Tax=Rhypophila decipiens TaxID=261697 RepID=A0AAN7B0X2_9PEZI|nr:hypothetical protein QBC37DRAFT_69842 [Rhypophila decipiens]